VVVWCGPRPNLESRDTRLELARRTYMSLVRLPRSHSPVGLASETRRRRRRSIDSQVNSRRRIRRPALPGSSPMTKLRSSNPTRTRLRLPAFYRAATPIISCGERIARSSYPTRTEGQSFGPPCLARRRSAAEVSIDTRHRPSPAEWEAVEAEAAALPLPGLNGGIAIRRS
jgi:hypothetical protein